MNDMSAPFVLGETQASVTIDDDGGVTISAPAIRKQKKESTVKGFNENLALDDNLSLEGIAEEVLDGYERDLQSRAGFIQNYIGGIDLLGLETKSSDQEKTSMVGHPLLLEAVVRAQSTSGAELMPAGGPCKVQTLAGDDITDDAIAQAFQDDMNAYLTVGAPEYYPDTDRGLFGLYYSGNMFKKVYNHMLRRRPCSETVGIEDLIVSEDATDLETAIRVTHRAEMAPNEVRRMQVFGDWINERLPTPTGSTNEIDTAQARVAGMSTSMKRPEDNSHEILETTHDLDLRDYGREDSDLPDLPLSYIVTMEKESRKVLAVRRGWQRGDEFFNRRQRFVHYGMIPGMNFLNLGFVHLLGNQTKALRGIWRMLVTAGMYANAPGGMKVKGLRMSTSEINPGPGEWVDIDIGSFSDIRQALMAMPYKDVSAGFMDLAKSIGDDAMRMAGMANMEVGEGRTNVPVGTMMSMIEVATQTMSAVHKRLHRAQARELMLIKNCFAENPAALSRLPQRKRDWATAEEFSNYNLAPASDPNVPSQIHRIQLATALVTVAGQNPDLYDRTAVHKRAWKTIGVTDADTFVLPQPAPPPQPAAGGAAPDPLIGQARMMEAQGKIEKVKQDGIDMQRKAAEAEIAHEQHTAELAAEWQSKQAQLASAERTHQSQERIEELRLEIEQARLASEHNREHASMGFDAASKVHAANTKAATDVHVAHVKAATDRHTAGLQADSQKLQSETARHVAGVSAKTATKVAAMKPKPKPATKSAGTKKK